MLKNNTETMLADCFSIAQSSNFLCSPLRTSRLFVSYGNELIIWLTRFLSR